MEECSREELLREIALPIPPEPRGKKLSPHVFTGRCESCRNRMMVPRRQYPQPPRIFFECEKCGSWASVYPNRRFFAACWY